MILALFLVLSTTTFLIGFCHNDSRPFIDASSIDDSPVIFGNDTLNLIVLNHTKNNLALAARGLFKRQPGQARSVNVCPQRGMPADYTHLRSSRCSRTRSPREFSIRCGSQRSANRPTDFLSRDGRCRGLEMCIDMVQNGILTAWCAPETSFEESLEARPKNRVSESVVSGTNRSGGENVEVILTTTNRRDTLYHAHHIMLVPSDSNENLLGPPSVCTSCSSLSFLHTPVGTANMEIHVIMKSIRDTANINGYVWTD